jgi:hypothetical protein
MLSPFLEAVIEPNKGWISPHLMSKAMRMPLTDLSHVLRVHRNTLTRHPDSQDIQTRLGQIVRIVSEVASMVGGDSNRAILWFRFEPLAGFDNKTAEQLVMSGNAEAVEVHLKMLHEGV